MTLHFYVLYFNFLVHYKVLRRTLNDVFMYIRCTFNWFLMYVAFALESHAV